MKPHALVSKFCAIAVLILSPYLSHADISGQTHARYRHGSRVILGPQKLTGATQTNTFGEAFSEGRKLTSKTWKALDTYLRGDLSGSRGSYSKALKWGSPKHLLISVDTHHLSLDPQAMYDQVTLDFQVWSNKKEIQYIRMASPEKEAFTFDAPRYGADRLSANARVHINPKSLVPGTYPILYTTREDNCQACLGLIHLVLVRVEIPCRRHPVNLECRPNFVERSRIELKTAAAFEYVRNLISHDPAVRTSIADIENTYRRCRVARGRQGISLIRCMDRAGGDCPELAYGATGPTCQKLREIDSELESIVASGRRIEDFFSVTNCCQ